MSFFFVIPSGVEESPAFECFGNFQMAVISPLPVVGRNDEGMLSSAASAGTDTAAASTGTDATAYAAAA